MKELDSQDARIEAIIDDENKNLNVGDAVEKFYVQLARCLQLPCNVTSIEDFRWEEGYVFGAGDSEEYRELRKSQPSYKDTFELLAIERDTYSEWMMFYGEDLVGKVRRKSDGKEFYLGLAEIEVMDKKSENYQLLDDYSVWFVNNR